MAPFYPRCKMDKEIYITFDCARKLIGTADDVKGKKFHLNLSKIAIRNILKICENIFCSNENRKNIIEIFNLYSEILNNKKILADYKIKILVSMLKETDTDRSFRWSIEQPINNN